MKWEWGEEAVYFDKQFITPEQAKDISNKAIHCLKDILAGKIKPITGQAHITIDASGDHNCLHLWPAKINLAYGRVDDSNDGIVTLVESKYV